MIYTKGGDDLRKADMNSKFVKVIYPKKEITFSYGFFETTEGQEYLKVIKQREYDIYCMCNGKGKAGISMHIAEYKNSFAIRNNRNEEANKTMHSSTCPRRGDKVDTDKKEGVKPEQIKIELMAAADGTKYANFNSRDFIDREVESGEASHKGENRYIANQYTSVFRIGETLLSLAWQNYIIKEGRLPREGNLFHILFKDIVPESKISETLSLADIMFMPSYKKADKDEVNDITDSVKKACYAIYKKGEGEKVKGHYMYVLAKINAEKELDEDTIELNLSDPYKKGSFNVTVNKTYYYNKHKSKKKVFNADYYISCFLSTNYNRIKIEKMATIPVMKDRGFYVQSSKEIQFAGQLINKDILLLKPSQSSKDVENWGKYIPDFLLLDKQTKLITTIAEVFGFYRHEYMIEMEEKIKFF